MKHIFALLMAGILLLPLAASFSASAVGTDSLRFDLDNENEVRFFGRAYQKGGVHYFNWSSSGFTCSFRGSGIKATVVSNAPSGSNTAYIKIYVDGVWQRDVALTAQSTELTLASDLDPAQEHTVKVLKRTNARSSSAGIRSLTLLDGQKLPPKPASERLIEFIGDSLTVGYSTLAGSQTSWSTATEDATKTYAEQIADAFGADYMITAISGRGIVRNTGGDTKLLMGEIYPALDIYNNPGVAYDFALQPDVIIINLGTNDADSNNANLSAAVFRAGTKQFLREVRSHNPQAEILYTYGLITSKFSEDIATVIKELREEGDDKIAYMPLSMCSGSEKRINHPKESAYQRRAKSIIDVLELRTGWEAEPEKNEPPVDTAPSAPVTDAIPADTAPVTAPATEQSPQKTNGCTSVACGAAALPITAAALLLCKKKKKKEKT